MILTFVVYAGAKVLIIFVNHNMTCMISSPTMFELVYKSAGDDV